MHIASDKLHRINHGRLLFLLDYIKFTGIDDYFYVKKGNNTFTLESSYNNELIRLDNNIFNFIVAHSGT